MCVCKANLVGFCYVFPLWNTRFFNFKVTKYTNLSLRVDLQFGTEVISRTDDDVNGLGFLPHNVRR